MKALLRKQFNIIKNQYLSTHPESFYNRGLSKTFINLLDEYEKVNNQKINVIGSYHYVQRSEIKPPQIDEKTYAFPRFQKISKKEGVSSRKVMQFKIYRKGNQYNEEVYGIKIPPKDHTTVYPEIVLVPLICFCAKTLHRVGYGGGYYDHYINQIKKLQKKTIFVGVGLEILKIKLQHFEPATTDQRLDYVITEEQIYHQVK